MPVIHLKIPVLSFFINRAYESYGFVSAFIYGPQGVGKTTYALKVLYYVYKDWDKVLENTYFYIDNLIPRLVECFKNNERIKAILLDDAGVWLLKYYWYKYFPIWFSKLFNLMRTICSGIIFTSVEVSDIVKFVRDKVRYRVAIRVVDDDVRKAIGYKVITLPTLERIVKRYFVDYFKLDLPSDVRREYESMRREAIERLLGEVHGKKRERKTTKEEMLEELMKIEL